MPNAPTPNEIFVEADAELEELYNANKLLSAEAQSYAAQVVSLTALLAEKGMAEISPHKWVDLGRVALTDYVRGEYQIEMRWIDDLVVEVTLRWEPGQVLLCEGFQRSPENTLALTMPSVRAQKHYPVQPPKPGIIPPRPARAGETIKWTTQDPAEQRAINEYNQAWQTYLRPVLEEATREMTNSRTETVQDEEELAYEAIQAVQERRQNPNPKTPRRQTIATALEMVAKKMQERAVSRS